MVADYKPTCYLFKQEMIMENEEIIKLMANIESETALKAFEQYMELQWFDTICTHIVGTIFIVLLSYIVCISLKELRKA